jgi:hypothetical protein
LTPPPYGVSLPHDEAWGLARVQRYSPRSLPYYRPHVSLSEALPSALASCGIPPNTSCGWHLLMAQHESTCQVPPFPVAIPRIRRAVLSTGFLGSAHRSMWKVAGAVSCAILAPARQPLALGVVHDGSSHLCLRCPEMRARRDTRVEAARLRRFSPLQAVENQSRAWGIRCHSCTGREGLAPS